MDETSRLLQIVNTKIQFEDILQVEILAERLVIS